MRTIALKQFMPATVKFRCDIVDAKTGRTVKRGIEQTNLLFDYGLNNLETRSWPALFSYFAIGTGTTPTRRDSGAVQFSRAGNVVSADGSFFEAGDVGRLLKFDSGEEMYITAFTSGTSVQVSVSGTLAASEGTVYYVNRNSLGVEVKRTSSLTTDTGDHGSGWNGTTGILSTWKTMIFSAEVATVTYREIGWSHQSSGASTINGAALIAGGGDTLVAGQQYKVKVQLDRLMTPRTARAIASGAFVDAWGAASEIIETVSVSVWNSSGAPASSIASEGFNDGSLEPSVSASLQLSTSSAALRSPSVTDNSTPGGGSLVGAFKAPTADAYVAGSFKRVFNYVFEAAQSNSASIRTAWLGLSNGASISHRVLLDANETKTSSQRLTIKLTKSWGRVLTN